jgi:hypothetical protein
VNALALANTPPPGAQQVGHGVGFGVEEGEPHAQGLGDAARRWNPYFYCSFHRTV